MTKEQHDQYDNNKNILLEPPGVMGSILLETARDRSTQYNIFNSLQMIGKKEAYIQIFKKKTNSKQMSGNTVFPRGEEYK